MIAGFMLLGFLWLGLILVVFGLSCNAVWRAVMAPPGTPRDAGCGSCGYELATLDGGRCSECGADLLKAGIVTRRNIVRTAGSLPAALMGWTIIVATIASIILYIISMVTMMSGLGGNMNSTRYDSNFTFAPARTYDPDLGEYVSEADFELLVDLDVAGQWGGAPDSGTIDFVFSRGNEEVTIAFADASLNEWTMTDADGTELRSGASIAANDALAALRGVGVSPQEEDSLPAFAAELEVLMDTALANPFDYEYMYQDNLPGEALLEQTGGGSMNNIAPAMFMATSPVDYIAPLTTFGVGFVLWLAGILFIIRRRSRLIAGPRA